LSRILLCVIESRFSAALDSICGLAGIMEQASGGYPICSANGVVSAEGVNSPKTSLRFNGSAETKRSIPGQRAISPAIVQIVPRRVGQPEGIGDYATRLANALLERSGCRSAFMVGTPVDIELPVKDAWLNSPVTVRTGSTFAKQLTNLCLETDSQAVVLHVAGYGYQKRGVPFWLLNGMQKWRQIQPGVCLIGIFHELFASNRVWNSSLWLSRAQRYIARELWRLCDYGLTTNDTYAGQLAAWRPITQNQLKILPVFSNVGEPETILPLLHRPAHMAVFGAAGVERAIYCKPISEQSAGVVNALGIQNVIDIGARVISVPRRLGHAAVTSMGQLSACLVSRHLLACRYGLLNYDVGCLGKSGVFAAFAAHGVIPIIIGSRAAPTDGLEESRHFLRWPFEKVLADLSEIQRNLVGWYEKHSVAEHADVLSLWSTEKM
jgi:hypothetical protein